MSQITFDFTDGTTTVSTAPWATTNYEFAPKARHSDPSTSHEAAVSVKPGNSTIITAIRAAVADKPKPLTAFEIAARVEYSWPRRWSEATIRTAVSRAGLRAVDTEGRSPRGQRCIRYSL